MGRHTVLTKKMIDRIAGKIKQGNYACVACQFVGISDRIYYKWIEKAKADIENDVKSIYVQFFHAIKEAEAIAEDRNVQLVQKAAIEDGSWQASAWYLERKHFERWGAKQKIEHTGHLQTLNIDPAKLSIAQLEAIAAIDPNEKNIEAKINAIVNNTNTIPLGAEEETTKKTE
jgi:hypothetical protein